MRTLDQDVPLALDGIVMRALELGKNRRFASKVCMGNRDASAPSWAALARNMLTSLFK